MEQLKKLQVVGASVLWLIALCVFLGQGYRAVAYYAIDMQIDWTWHDIVIFGFAFLAMFAPAKLKSIVIETAKRVASKK